MDADVIVIGGGVLGTSLAYHLGLRAQRVVLLERETQLGCHASGKNAGMFRQLYRHPQLTEWAARSRESWPEILREQCFQMTGSFVCGRAVPEHHQNLFLDCELQSESGGMLSGVYTETDGLLDSPLYLLNLRKLLPKNYVQVICGAEVVSTTRKQEHHSSAKGSGGFWEVSTVSGDCFAAPLIVNAAGAWLNRFLDSEYCVDALPYARHLFVVNGWKRAGLSDTDLLKQVDNIGFFWDEFKGWYLRSWGRDERLVSSCDRIPAHPETFVAPPDLSENLAETLLLALPQTAPSLAIGRQWFCFRTYTEDQLPIWGFDQRVPGLFWLGAFGGFGMSTSFAATGDAAELIVSGKGIDCLDFLPDRTALTSPPEFSPERVPL